MHYTKAFRCAMCLPLALALILSFSCAHWRSRTGSEAEALTLTVVLDTEKYQPGAPVIATVVMQNVGEAARTLPMPDQTTLHFSFMPRTPDGGKAMRFIEPVVSRKMKTGQPYTVDAGTSVTRIFEFTTLTFKRGDYVFQTYYEFPTQSTTRPAVKIYARAVPFSVEGVKAFTHRSPDGLMAQQDAMDLAKRQVRGKVHGTEARMVQDNAGFLKWQVNVMVETPEGKPTTKSYYIDPYRACIWGEAKPFTHEREKQPAIPKDSKILQKMRERRNQPAGAAKPAPAPAR